MEEGRQVGRKEWREGGRLEEKLMVILLIQKKNYTKNIYSKNS